MIQGTKSIGCEVHNISAEDLWSGKVHGKCLLFWYLTISPTFLFSPKMKTDVRALHDLSLYEPLGKIFPGKAKFFCMAESMYQIIRAVNGCFSNVNQAFAVFDQKVRTGHLNQQLLEL